MPQTSPSLITGPVLYFRGVSGTHWHLAALVVTAADQQPPELKTNSKSFPPHVLSSGLAKTVWRYDFAVPMDCDEAVGYGIGDQHWRIYPPNGEHLRIAYTACNGFEHNNCLIGADPKRNERWRHLGLEHLKSPFQLLIQGGDQLYADDVWREVPELAAWRSLKRSAQINARLSPQAEAAARDFYFDSYCQLWAQQDLAPIVASIPSVMMWDDHDIFDGWGSHPDALQRCAVFASVWKVAREQFALFQLASTLDELPTMVANAEGEHFGWAFAINTTGFIAPDLRSQRSRCQVMGETGWRWMTEALRRLGRCRQVFFVSTVPVINLNLSWLERLVAPLPAGRHLYQDDFRDQWRSYQHRQEWRRLVMHLLEFSRQTQTRVTILSGEIHLGAAGIVEQDDTQIFQLTSSGVVHDPPPRLLARVFDLLSQGSAVVSDGARMRMLPLPHLGRRYLDARNWLSLDYTGDALQVCWHSEAEPSAMPMRIE